jgi:rubrerythrin
MGKTKVTPQSRARIAEMREKLGRLPIPKDFAAATRFQSHGLGTFMWKCLACSMSFTFCMDGAAHREPPNFCPHCGRQRATEN